MNLNNNLFPIAKQGLVCVIYTLGFALLFLILGFEFLAFLAFIFSVLIGYIYRNPERELFSFEEKSVKSPIDGELLSVEELENSEYAYKLIFNSGILDVGVLRVPMTSSVVSVSKINGARLCKTSQLSTKINENATIIFEDNVKNKVKVSHILKQSICGIDIENIDQKNILQSVRYGIMVNGTTYIYLPQNFRLNIQVGDKVISSQTLIGYFS